MTKGYDAKEAGLLWQLTRAPELEPILDLLVEELSSIPELAGYNISLIDGAPDRLVCKRLRFPDGFRHLEETYRNARYPMNPGDISHECLARGRPLYVDRGSIGSYSEVSKARFGSLGLTGQYTLPLGLRRHMGTLSLFERNHPLAATERARIKRLLELIGPSLEAAAELHMLQRREQALSEAEASQRAFLTFAASISRLRTPSEVYRTLCLEFLRRHPFDFAGIAIRHDDEMAVESLNFRTNEHAERLAALSEFYRRTRFPASFNGSAISVVLQQNVPMHFRDIAALVDAPMLELDRRALALMGTPRSFLFLPLRHSGEAIGVLWLGSVDQVVEISELEIGWLELLAGLGGTAIGNAQLYTVLAEHKAAIETLNAELEDKVAQLAELATRDKLTGLHNFGAFDAELRRRVAEAARSHSEAELSLVIIDVDHFKRINDTFGHLAGNAVLQEVAQRILKAVRAMDMVCRYGGEEFVVILPKCDAEGARCIAERLRRSIGDTPCIVEGKPYTITASLGCATLRVGEDASGIQARADKALYRAKQSGRNRVESAD